MARLLNRLRQGSFAVTVEVNPPRKVRMFPRRLRWFAGFLTGWTP